MSREKTTINGGSWAQAEADCLDFLMPVGKNLVI
jgi:hypothetical protein